MSDAFPTTGIFRRGYGKNAVDDFFVDARHAYEGGLPAEQFSAEQVRQASFPRQRNGYDTQAVDAAMSRLEAAFVQRDRADHIAVNGEAAWYEKVADRATTMPSRSMIFWIGSLPSSMIVRNFWLTMFATPYSRPHAARKHMRWVQLMPILAVQSRSFSP